MPKLKDGAAPSASPGSELFAAQLRSGPIRAMIDRAVRSAADQAGVPYMVLGIRYGDFYEFISTYGFPLTHYSDRVPASLLGVKLFAREVEVADLQKQAQFTPLGIAPVAKNWRYGANCPVRIGRTLSDGGVLALSCADVERRETGGHIPGVLRQHAEFISDLIWLSNQVQRHDLVADPISVIASVLQVAVTRFRMPVCIVDGERRVLGQSEAFVDSIRSFGGARPQIGARLVGGWFGPDLEQAVAEAVTTGTPQQWLPVVVDAEQRLFLDAFPFAFPDLAQFAVLALHEGKYAHVAMALEAAAVGPGHADAPMKGDGVGPITRFLEETLIPAQRLIRRNETSYVGVRRWRSAIRKHQISALRALKSDLPNGFVTRVASELADAVRAIYGSPDACVVVPVPCGHSGPGCLSSRLAQALAKELGVTAVDAFAPADVPRGSSHPRKNKARPSMQLIEPIDRPVILVDDVASSGSHIDEAATLLRRSAPSVWPVVWIAP